MKTRPLTMLPAVSAAVLFLTILPSCGPEEGAGSRKQAKGGPLAAPAAGNDSDRSGAAAPQADPLQAARVEGARRDFLLRRRLLQPGTQWKAGKTAEEYYALRMMWVADLISHGDDDQDEDEAKVWAEDMKDSYANILEARRKWETFGTGRADLTPEGQAEWDALEAKRWAGYTPVPPEIPFFLRGVPMLGKKWSPENWARANFEARTYTSLRGLMDEMEHLDFLSGAAKTILAAREGDGEDQVVSEDPPAAAPTGGVPPEDELRTLQKARSRTQAGFDALVTEAKEHFRQWEEKGWEGYAVEPQK